jgi:nucleoside-triphosphatase
MSDIWLISGPPGVGKSTLISRVILRLKSAGVIVGGISTLERREGGERVGFMIRDLTNEAKGELASVSSNVGPRVGKYRVNLSDLASVGARGLSDAAKSSELIVIDELGPMELVSPEFRRAVTSCIASGKPILAVVHERLEDDLIEELRAPGDGVNWARPTNLHLTLRFLGAAIDSSRFLRWALGRQLIERAGERPMGSRPALRLYRARRRDPS